MHAKWHGTVSLALNLYGLYNTGKMHFDVFGFSCLLSPWCRLSRLLRFNSSSPFNSLSAMNEHTKISLFVFVWSCHFPSLRHMKQCVWHTLGECQAIRMPFVALLAPFLLNDGNLWISNDKSPWWCDIPFLFEMNLCGRRYVSESNSNSLTSIRLMPNGLVSILFFFFFGLILVLFFFVLLFFVRFPSA